MPPSTALTLSPEEADLSVAAIDAFTVALGGRKEVLEALQVANGTPDVDQIVNLLLDPRYAGWSLRKICTLAGLTIADLFVAYKKAMLVKAHLQATKVVTDHLVHVVEDVMRRSQPHEEPCAVCGASGTVPAGLGSPPGAPPLRCEACHGRGRTLQQPELDRQKLALELGQLVIKGGGISLTQQTLVAPPGSGFGPGAIVALQQAVGEILAPKSRRQPAQIVDATLVEDSAHASTPSSV
jgi:hypothetical protein